VLGSSKFSQNIATANGGGILINKFTKLIIESDLVVQENRATIGGGVRLLNDLNTSNRNYTNFTVSVSNNQAALFGNNYVTYLDHVQVAKASIATDSQHDETDVIFSDSSSNSVNSKTTDGTLLNALISVISA